MQKAHLDRLEFLGSVEILGGLDYKGFLEIQEIPVLWVFLEQEVPMVILVRKDYLDFQGLLAQQDLMVLLDLQVLLVLLVNLVYGEIMDYPAIKGALDLQDQLVLVA